MKISYNWLQHYIEQELPIPEKLAEVITSHVWEVEEVEQDEVRNDYVLDIKVLPDRAHDALSHYGVAREVAGILGFTLKDIFASSKHYPVFRFSLGQEVLLPATCSVTISTPQCVRYETRKIANVTVGESPKWLKEKLEAIGQRSINNIVDATNYVLLATGQPTHVFDGDKTSGNFELRMARAGELMTTLDAKECILDESMMVVAEKEGVVLALAGIKGGVHAQTTNETKNILLDVAKFNAESVRKTEKKLVIATDASKRFENEISPLLINDAMEMLTGIICSIAGGQVEEKVISGSVLPDSKKQITISLDYINKLLGTELSLADIANVLSSYKYEYLEEESSFTVFVPSYRLDLNFDYDLVDEIGRVIGYEKVLPTSPSFSELVSDNSDFTNSSLIRNYLLTNGYSETITYSFRKKGDVEMYGGIKGKSALRTNILDGLKESFEVNKLNSALLDNEEIKIFEIGSIFPEGNERFSVALVTKKEAKEYTLDEFLTAFPEAKSPVVIDPCSESSVNNSPIEKEKDIKKFSAWSLYPFITRDISVWVPESVTQNELFDLYKELGTSLLVRDPRLVDSFSKEGRTSYAFRLVFQSFEKTLTDDDVKPITDAIYAKLSEKGFEIR